MKFHSTLQFFVVLSTSIGYLFSERNTTNLLFEYLFLQSECEQGSFQQHEYINNTSFGVLLRKDASSCLPRSGYHSISDSLSYAFESNGTFAGTKSRVLASQKISLEMWLKMGDISNDHKSIISISSISVTNTTTKDDLLLEQFYGFLMLTLRTQASSTVSFVPSVDDYDTILHLVISYSFTTSSTTVTSYINGTQCLSRDLPAVDVSSWTTGNKLYGSLPNVNTVSRQRWGGEIYYFGMYESSLTSSQVLHNYQCSIPPSVPSLRETMIHGLMNTLITIVIPIYDNNVITNTNIDSEYTTEVHLISVPSKGWLYSSSLSPITSVPENGTILSNSTLFYRPVDNEWSASPYTYILLAFSNRYGASKTQKLDIFIDWTNSAPVVSNRTFSMNTDSILNVTVQVVDIDGDKDHMTVISLTEVCTIKSMYNFSISIEYNGGSIIVANDTCVMRFVVVDTGGLVSNIGVYTIFISNEIIPTNSTLVVDKGISKNSTIHFMTASTPCVTDDVIIVIVSSPKHGEATSSSDCLTYTSDPLYFSSPKIDISGKELYNDDDTMDIVLIHKGIKTIHRTLTIIINNVNTEPLILSPNIIRFYVDKYTPITNITVNDNDNDTQLCTLYITSNTGYFLINTTSLQWIAGNYGDGMLDNKLEARGAISSINAALKTLQFRAIYRLNDTLVIHVIDGPFDNERRILMQYKMEDTDQLSNNFYIIIIIISIILLLWIISLCCKCCSSLSHCCCKKKKESKKKRQDSDESIELSRRKSSAKKKDTKTSTAPISPSQPVTSLLDVPSQDPNKSGTPPVPLPLAMPSKKIPPPPPPMPKDLNLHKPAPVKSEKLNNVNSRCSISSSIIEEMNARKDIELSTLTPENVEVSVKRSTKPTPLGE